MPQLFMYEILQPGLLTELGIAALCNTGLLSESILSLLLWVANYMQSFAGGNRQQYSPHQLQADVKHDMYVYFNPS